MANNFTLLQEPREFQAFTDILRAEDVRSYLEIGSMWGGSLWQVAQVLPLASRLVSIDSMFDRPEAEQSLRTCVSGIVRMGHDAHLIIGDSRQQETIEAARKLGPFHALFIDGDHAAESVMSDWINYGPMACIVGFHDINWNSTWKSSKPPASNASKMGVPEVWEKIKQGQRFKEFKYHPTQNYYGIGVIWR